jgi:hypothetical protein
VPESNARCVACSYSDRRRWYEALVLWVGLPTTYSVLLVVGTLRCKPGCIPTTPLRLEHYGEQGARPRDCIIQCPSDRFIGRASFMWLSFFQFLIPVALKEVHKYSALTKWHTISSFASHFPQSIARFFLLLV